MQPSYSDNDCMFPSIQQEAPQPVTVLDHAGVPAEWMILLLIVLIAGFEVWALATQHNTLSHFIQRLSTAHHWLKWLGLAGLGLLGWHLFWGF